VRTTIAEVRGDYLGRVKRTRSNSKITEGKEQGREKRVSAQLGILLPRRRPELNRVNRQGPRAVSHE